MSQSSIYVGVIRQTRCKEHGILDGLACALAEIGCCWVSRIAQQGDTALPPAGQWNAVHYVVAQDVGRPRGFDDFGDRRMPGPKNVLDVGFAPGRRVHASFRNIA
jgi:hypothetical protein